MRVFKSAKQINKRGNMNNKYFYKYKNYTMGNYILTFNLLLMDSLAKHENCVV